MAAVHTAAHAAITERKAAVEGEAEEALAGVGGVQREQIAAVEQVGRADRQRGALAAGEGEAVIVGTGGDGEALGRGRVEQQVGGARLAAGGQLIFGGDPGDLVDEQRGALDLAVADRPRLSAIAARAEVQRARLDDLIVGHDGAVGAQPHRADPAFDHGDGQRVAADRLGAEIGARHEIAAPAVEAGHRADHFAHLIEGEIAVQPGRYRLGQVDGGDAGRADETDGIDPGHGGFCPADFGRA